MAKQKADEAPEATNQIALVTEPEKKITITGLKFETPEQVRAVSRALEKRVAKLTDLAKKNREEGKDAEAKSIEKEIGMIKETLAPQLKAQTPIQFNDRETLVQIIARVFITEFRYRLRNGVVKAIKPKPGEKFEDARATALAKLDDFDTLLGNAGTVAAELVHDLLTETAERAYHKGSIAHQATPSAIAREALQAQEDLEIIEAA